MTEEKDDTIALWYQADRELKDLKAKEMYLRKQVIEKHFSGDEVKAEGTTTIPIEGANLKLSKSFNYKIADEDFEPDDKEEEFAEKKITVSSLFPKKVSFSKTFYNTLTPKQKHFVDEHLEIKPASPSLKLIPVKQEA